MRRLALSVLTVSLLIMSAGCAYFGPYGNKDSGMKEAIQGVNNRRVVEYSYWNVFGFVGGGKIRVEGE